MFTSRAEYRLRLRADNADQRLTPVGVQIGCVGRQRAQAFRRKLEILDQARRLLHALSLTPSEALRHGLDIKRDGRRRTAFELLALPGVDAARLRIIWPELAFIPPAAADELAVDARYAAYVDRQEADVVAFRKEEGVPIPANLDYAAVTSLSAEVRERLEALRPSTLAQASRMEGMTPAALMRLLTHLKKLPIRTSASTMRSSPRL